MEKNRVISVRGKIIRIGEKKEKKKINANKNRNKSSERVKRIRKNKKIKKPKEEKKEKKKKISTNTNSCTFSSSSDDDDDDELYSTSSSTLDMSTSTEITFEIENNNNNFEKDKKDKEEEEEEEINKELNKIKISQQNNNQDVISNNSTSHTQSPRNMSHSEKVARATWQHIDESSIQIIESLCGEGSTSLVHKAKWQDQIIALKVLNSEVIDKQNFMSELKLLASLQCDHLVQFIGGNVENRWIATEYIHGGTLDNWIHSSSPECVLPLVLVKKLCIDILNGLIYLHDQGIIHRDLKTDNILLYQPPHFDYKNNNLLSLQAKIIDVGCARILNTPGIDFAKTAIGAVKVRSPEMMANMEYGTPTDIYSFGVLVAEMLSRDVVIDCFQHVFEIQTKKRLSTIMQGKEERFPPLMVNIIDQCWATDPEQRPKCSQLLQDFMNWKVV